MPELVPLRRNARFQALWAGSFVSALGSHLSALAYPLLVLAVTGSPAKAGLVSAVQLAATVAASLPAGVLVDRLDRRRILVACELVRAATLAGVAAAVWTDRVTLTHLMAAAAVQGAAGALFGPARLVAVRSVVPAPQLRPALARDQTRIHAAKLAGPVLGGLLFGIGRAVPFLVDAISYLVSAGCVLIARVPRRPASARPATPRDAAATGMVTALRWLSGRPFVRAVCGFSLATNLAAGGLVLTLVVLVRERGASSALIGTVMAMAGVGGLLGAVLSGRISRLLPPGRLIVAFGWWTAAMITMMALPFGVFWPGVMLAAVMLVMPAVDVTILLAVLDGVPDELQGRITSVLMATNLSVAPLAPLVAGLLIGAVGPVRTLLLQGAFLAVVSVAAALGPGLRHPVTEPTEVEPRSARPLLGGTEFS